MNQQRRFRMSSGLDGMGSFAVDACLPTLTEKPAALSRRAERRPMQVRWIGCSDRSSGRPNFG
jgi:hypothetical protein